MKSDLSGRRIVLTGAGNGIGRATALAAARNGAKVLGTDIDEAGLQETLRLIKEQTPEATAAVEVLDSTDAAAAAEVLGRYAAEWGGLDGLGNIAGKMYMGMLIDSDLATLEQAFRINVGGMFVMTQAIVPLLADGGVIVNVNSSSAAHVTPGISLYGSTKAANMYLTQAFSQELADRNVRVCGIGPGAVDTQFPRSVMPAGEEGEKMLQESVKHAQTITRLAQPDEIATAINYLLSDDAGYIAGTTLWIDGGSR